MKTSSSVDKISQMAMKYLEVLMKVLKFFVFLIKFDHPLEKEKN